MESFNLAMGQALSARQQGYRRVMEKIEKSIKLHTQTNESASANYTPEEKSYSGLPIDDISREENEDMVLSETEHEGEPTYHNQNEIYENNSEDANYYLT